MIRGMFWSSRRIRRRFGLTAQATIPKTRENRTDKSVCATETKGKTFCPPEGGRYRGKRRFHANAKEPAERRRYEYGGDGDDLGNGNVKPRKLAGHSVLCPCQAKGKNNLPASLDDPRDTFASLSASSFRRPLQSQIQKSRRDAGATKASAKTWRQSGD
jgi:hypothetical protein